MCLSEVILSNLEHSKHLKQDVLWALQGCLLGVSGCFIEVSRVFQGSFKGVSRKFQGCFKEVSRKFQGCFKEVPRVFYESFREEEVSMMFHNF